MATYWDSSALLEILLDGAGAASAARYWRDDEVRLTSVLLEAECVTVLRRAARSLGIAPDAPALHKRVAALEGIRQAMIVRDVDGEVLDVLRRADGLDQCRSLDALHLATAMLFRLHLDEALVICTFDRRMRELATTHGFPVIPVT